MYILNQDGDNLINLDKIIKVYIQPVLKFDYWELRAVYSISYNEEPNETYDVIGKYSSKEECKEVIDKIMTHLNVVQLN